MRIFPFVRIFVKCRKNKPYIYCNKFYTSLSTQIEKSYPVFIEAQKFGNRVAVVDGTGEYTYSYILHQSRLLSQILLSQKLVNDYGNCRICFMCSNDVNYVIAQWACWLSGSVAVPLCPSHPPMQIQYCIEDSQSEIIISTEEYADKVCEVAQKLKVHHVILNSKLLSSVQNSTELMPLTAEMYKTKDALIVYTSGTTGMPKGVVLTHKNLIAQMLILIEAWRWTSSDKILHVMPLHHLHGILFALMCSLYCGATCVFLPTFQAGEVWSKLLGDSGINVFMAVPTMYIKLIDYYEEHYAGFDNYSITKEYIKAYCKQKIRLMVSGSSSLPESIFKRWFDITGHYLLERYGMTEIGICLSNSLHNKRIPGSVGNPLPTVQVCITKPNFYSSLGYNVIMHGNHQESEISLGMDNEAGELFVKGPSVFSHYWNNTEATRLAFTKDGWFKTGDIAKYVNGSYKILGRSSVDIIKSGGYKISALEVEQHLLTHHSISECAVLGIPDIMWGQKVVAVVCFRRGKENTDVTELKNWCKSRMPSYSVPSMWKVIDLIPRNIIGKINKKDLLNYF